LKEKVAVPVQKSENTAVGVHPQKLALTSPASGSRSSGIVHSWTEATELIFFSYVVGGCPPEGCDPQAEKPRTSPLCATVAREL
jgi:hypothetical protein